MASPGTNDEDGVVDPEDLDISKDERVNELREGQYVIATGNSGGVDADADVEQLRSDPPNAPLLESDEGTPHPAVDPRTALVDHLDSLSVANGIVAAGRFDGTVDVHECRSDDPGTVFAELLTWYASNVDAETPAPEVLVILCLAGGISVRYPVRALGDVLRAEGLSPDDSIRDLLEAVQDDGLVIPRQE